MQWTRESPKYRRACHIRRNFDKAYDRLKRDWAEKFLSVDREDSDSAPLDLLVKNSTNAEIGDWRLQEGDRQAKKLRRGKVLIESALWIGHSRFPALQTVWLFLLYVLLDSLYILLFSDWTLWLLCLIFWVNETKLSLLTPQKRPPKPLQYPMC